MAARIENLLARARSFREGPFLRQRPLYLRLVREGQAPKILMISCSDSRVDPSAIFAVEPGEIFMVRNIAALVPPLGHDKACSSTGAALEFGVAHLGVEHVVVLGHAHCGGVKALLRGAGGGEADFIGSWLSCARAVRDRVVKELPHASHVELVQALERETVRQSVRNLMTFPWIEERVRAGKLSLHGWRFDIAEGALAVVMKNGEPLPVSD